MTIRENLEKFLFDHAMWPEEAKAAVELMAADPTQESMKGRWDSQTDGYPEVLVRVLRITVKKFAIQWLKANKPKHFALAVLEEPK